MKLTTHKSLKFKKIAEGWKTKVAKRGLAEHLTDTKRGRHQISGVVNHMNGVTAYQKWPLIMLTNPRSKESYKAEELHNDFNW